MCLSAEYKTIKLIVDSNFISYFFTRTYYSYFSSECDKNLLTLLDTAIQTKRYGFIKDLNNSIVELVRADRPNIATHKDFIEQLLAAFDNEMQDHGATASDAGLKVMKKAINKYIDAHNLSTKYRISKTENFQGKTQEQVEQSRNKSFWAGVFSLLLAFLVAFPEGALAVYGYGVFTLSKAFLLGGAAFAVSYFLYVGEIGKFLKKPFASSTRRSIAPFRRYCLDFILIFAGIAMGVMLFNSVYIPGGILFLGFSSAAALLAAPMTPALALLLGASLLFAIVCAVANIALFGSVCYDTYIAVTNYQFSWKNIPSLKTAFLSVSILAMGFAQYWFYTEAYKTLNLMLGFSAPVCTALAGVIGVFGILNGVFYAKNINTFLNNVYEWINSTSQVIDKQEVPFNLNRKRTAINAFRTGIIIVLALCCFGNAIAMATGVAALFSYQYSKYCANGLIFMGSFTANLKGSYEEFSLPPSVPSVVSGAAAMARPSDLVYNVFEKTKEFKPNQGQGAGASEWTPMFARNTP